MELSEALSLGSKDAGLRILDGTHIIFRPRWAHEPAHPITMVESHLEISQGIIPRVEIKGDLDHLEPFLPRPLLCPVLRPKLPKLVRRRRAGRMGGGDS